MLNKKVKIPTILCITGGLAQSRSFPKRNVRVTENELLESAEAAFFRSPGKAVAPPHIVKPGYFKRKRTISLCPKQAPVSSHDSFTVLSSVAPYTQRTNRTAAKRWRDNGGIATDRDEVWRGCGTVGKPWSLC